MSEYPKLMWAPDGREFTVCDSVEEEARRAEGFRLAVDPVAATPLGQKPYVELGSNVSDGDEALEAVEPKKKAKK
jgi:hypothetical protein